jgi:hypothetical protein
MYNAKTRAILIQNQILWKYRCMIEDPKSNARIADGHVIMYHKRLDMSLT